MQKEIPAPKWEVVVDPDARAISSDELCRMAFGLSFEQLVIAIKTNSGGKYDFFYKSDNERLKG
jgi:hypothetical protein